MHGRECGPQGSGHGWGHGLPRRAVRYLVGSTSTAGYVTGRTMAARRWPLHGYALQPA